MAPLEPPAPVAVPNPIRFRDLGRVFHLTWTLLWRYAGIWIVAMGSTLLLNFIIRFVASKLDSDNNNLILSFTLEFFVNYLAILFFICLALKKYTNRKIEISIKSIFLLFLFGHGQLYLIKQFSCIE